MLARVRGLMTVLLVLGAAVASAATEPQPLTVFAAASLTEPFTALGERLEQRLPSVTVRFNFAGSQQLAAQIERGAVADVFASADQGWMSFLQDRNLLAGPPRPFARNRLVVVLPAGNPGRVERLQDLARAGIKLVLAAAAVPVGHYSRAVLDNLSRDATFGSAYSAQVLHNVVSEEDNVKAVLAKVQLGEADAGIVYQSDVTGSAAASVRTIAIPAPFNVEARYPIAVVRGTASAAFAQAFIDLVLSPDGQAVLQRAGFEPLESPSHP